MLQLRQLLLHLGLFGRVLQVTLSSVSGRHRGSRVQSSMLLLLKLHEQRVGLDGLRIGGHTVRKLLLLTQLREPGGTLRGALRLALSRAVELMHRLLGLRARVLPFILHACDD